MSTDENKTKRRRAIDKSKRVPFGAHRTKLQLSDKDQEQFEGKWNLRWVNDQDGRIAAAEHGGYTFVHPDDVPSLGSGSLHGENSDPNARVSKVVSKGTQEPIRAYLMKINMDWYKEDQLAKEEINLQVDRSLLPVSEGGASIEGGYTPAQ